MSEEETRLREYRRRNFARLLNSDSEVVSPHYLAKRLKCLPNYISQLKTGVRDISFDTARQIEELIRAPRLSLDNPPTSDTVAVSAITDKELAERIVAIVDDECRRLKRKKPRASVIEDVIKLSVSDARASGFNEARIRFLAKEFCR